MLKEHKDEIQRWLNNPKELGIWVRNKKDKGIWGKINFEDCEWHNDFYYIVDDEQADLRRLQKDKPDTRFEFYSEHLGGWREIGCHIWDINLKYRIKQDFSYPIFKVANKGTDKEVIVKFTGLEQGIVVFKMPNSPYSIGYETDEWVQHTNNYWQDVVYSPERDLYDKQPVICWDNNKVINRNVGFYDAENDRVLNNIGFRNGYKYENYIPYPYPDDNFITEMYKKLGV